MKLTKREVVGRYRGSILGIIWSFFNPVLLLVVYTFVFSVVFQSKWNAGSGSKTEFAVVLFAGLIVYGIFSECINRAPSLVLANPQYVKKVVFPLEVLPIAALGVSLFHAGVSFSVLLLFFALTEHMLHWTLIFLPLVLLPLCLFTLGLSWFLSSLGVFLRDVGHTVSLLTTVLMFTSPIFYPIDALPDPYRSLLALNPLAVVIEQTREVLIWGVSPNWITLLGMTTLSTGIAWLGFAWFQKTRSAFGDVL